MYYIINNNNIHLNEKELIEKINNKTQINTIHKYSASTTTDTGVLFFNRSEGVLNRYVCIEYKYFPEFYGNIILTDFDSSIVDYLTL